MGYRSKHNTDYFTRIDTAEKAYWLGFITADGCVTTLNRVKIMLSDGDVAHLRKFQRAVGSTNKIDRGRPGTAAVVLKAEETVAALRSFGIGERKTCRVGPANLPERLVPHFWRGVFDGDGCLNYDKANRRWRLALTGNRPLVDAFARYVQELCGYSSKVFYQGRAWRFFVSRKVAVKAVIRKLYEGAEPVLDRKMDSAHCILSW